MEREKSWGINVNIKKKARLKYTKWELNTWRALRTLWNIISIKTLEDLDIVS